MTNFLVKFLPDVIAFGICGVIGFLMLLLGAEHITNFIRRRKQKNDGGS